MSDIVLFQPRTGALDKINTRLPLGLLYAASLAHREGYNVKIIDQRLEGWEHALGKELRGGPAFFGTTCMTGPQIAHALEAARMVRQKTDLPVVFGGVHPTIMPGETLKNPLVDMVVRGEGEKTLLELLKTLENGRCDKLDSIPGLSYKKEGKIVHNPDRPFMKGDEIPIPPYELLDMKKYRSVSFRGERSYSIMASRGCPFRCGFCYNQLYNRGMWRSFPLEKVIENVKVLVEDYGAKTLYFEDDNICTDRERFEGLLRGVARYGIGLAFQGIRMDVIDTFTAETFRLMDRVADLSLDISIESVNRRVLTMVDKSLTVETVMSALRKLESHDYICKFNFIMGLPGETMEEMGNDIRFGLRLNRRHRNSYSLFNIYTPYPGTKLFEAAMKKGFRPPRTLEGWSAFSQLGWMRPGNSWLSQKEIDHLKSVSFLFMFAKPNIAIKASGKLKKMLVRGYSPFARFRLSSGCYWLFFEKSIAEQLGRG